jgi:hypothetical protein
MTKYKVEKIKVINMFQTDLSKGDLKGGEEVIFESMRSGRVLATVEVKDDKYVIHYNDGRAIIPFAKEEKNANNRT